MRCRVVPALLVLSFLLYSGLAAAQTKLVAGYDDRPARGPQAATGAVIYSHGLARVAESAGQTPYVVDALQESGWDVFRLQRRWAGDTLEMSVPALVQAMKTLRGRGYKRLVLVGNSFGGWISLAAARPGNPPVDAVIALSPAAFGSREEATDWTENATALYPLAEKVAAKRVLVFLFQDDDYGPEGRAEKLQAIFDRRHLTAEAVDRPRGLSGHDSGLTRAFARRFGPCIRDYVETTRRSPLFVCPEPESSALTGFKLPADLTIRPPEKSAPPALAAMAGRWYGYYENGREVLFVVDDVGKDRARAVYSFGPLARDGDTRSDFTRRRGEFDAVTGILHFSEPQFASRIDCQIIGDGLMALSLSSRADGEQLLTFLRRVE